MTLIHHLTHTQRVASAFNWAVLAHTGQTYNKLPYWTHLLTVANNLIDPTETELVAALLHDIVEDTYVTVADVRESFGDKVADIVDLVTQHKGLSYAANIARITESGNLSAMRVKLADNKANIESDKSIMDPERAASLTERWKKSRESIILAMAFHMEAPHA